MKNYTITVNGTAYDVVVEEKDAGAAPAAVSAPKAQQHQCHQNHQVISPCQIPKRSLMEQVRQRFCNIRHLTQISDR